MATVKVLSLTSNDPDVTAINTDRYIATGKPAIPASLTLSVGDGTGCGADSSGYADAAYDGLTFVAKSSVGINDADWRKNGPKPLWYKSGLEPANGTATTGFNFDTGYSSTYQCQETVNGTTYYFQKYEATTP